MEGREDTGRGVGMKRKDEQEIKCAIRKLQCEREKNNTPSLDIAYGRAMDALEKQIPKSPGMEGDGYDDDGELIFDTWICPFCGRHYEVDYDDYEYCPNCGQHIDASEIN